MNEEELYHCIKGMATIMEKKYKSTYINTLKYKESFSVSYIKPSYIDVNEVRGIALIHDIMIREVLLNGRASHMIVLIENRLLLEDRGRAVGQVVRRYKNGIFGTCMNGLEEDAVLASLLSLLVGGSYTHNRYVGFLPPAERVEWSPQRPSYLRFIGCRWCRQVHVIDFAKRNMMVPYLVVSAKARVTSRGGSSAYY